MAAPTATEHPKKELAFTENENCVSCILLQGQIWRIGMLEYFSRVNSSVCMHIALSVVFFDVYRSEGFLNLIFHPCALRVRGLARWESGRRAAIAVGVTWTFRSPPASSVAPPVPNDPVGLDSGWVGFGFWDWIWD